MVPRLPCTPGPGSSTGQDRALRCNQDWWARARNTFGVYRVGSGEESSNPGPPQFLRRLRRGASTISEVASTVPASAQDVQAGRSPEVGGSPTVVDMSVDDSDREDQAHMSGNRFTVLGEDVDRLNPVARVSQNPDFVGSDHKWDPDTESIGGASEVDDGEVVPEQSLFENPHCRGAPCSHHWIL